MRVLRPDDLRCPVDGKRAYPTEARAIAELEAAWTRPQRSEPRATMPRRAYLCESCGWWHLASRWKRP